MNSRFASFYSYPVKVAIARKCYALLRTAALCQSTEETYRLHYIAGAWLREYSE